MLIEVSDSSPDPPEPRDADAGAERGQRRARPGPQIVAALIERQRYYHRKITAPPPLASD